MIEHDADDDGYWDDDTPSADPGIRLAYEAALGRLILAHNELDYRLTTIIGSAAGLLSKDPALADLASGDFATRLRNLRLLKSLPADLGLSRVDCDRLADLNGQRNIVVHGHFDQNPFDGSFTLKRPRRWSAEKKHKVATFPVSRLAKLASDVAAEADRLRHVEAFYDFQDITIVSPLET